MKDPKVAELRAKVRGQQLPTTPKIEKRESPRDLNVDKEKIANLKKLQSDETKLPINPLKDKVKQLENELKKPTPKPIIDIDMLKPAINKLMVKFRSLLAQNQKAKDKGEADIVYHKTTILQLNRRSELLNVQLAEADELGIEAQRTLNNARRAEVQVVLDREGLEADKRSWLSRLPSLQSKVDIKNQELSSLTSEVSKQKFNIQTTQRLLKGTELKLLLVKVDTKAHIRLQGELEGYKQQVGEARNELTKLDENKAIKSGELQNAVILKERAESEIDRVSQKSNAVHKELEVVRSSVSEAEDVLVEVREASVNILAQSEKIIRVATEKRADIEKEAKGIIPVLKSQIVKTKSLQTVLKSEIEKFKDKQIKADKAESNYRRATRGQELLEQGHNKARRKFELLSPRLNELISRAGDKVSEFITKIKLLEPMLASISQAQTRLTKLITENKAIKKAHNTERKVFKKWRKDLDIREKRVEDKEQSLRSAEEEFKRKGII